MLFKVVAVAALVTAAGLSGALAQSADLRGPSELPPASFAGDQYVDSRGCVFLRAGVSGRTNWVPRINSRREALCGYPPSLGGRTAVAVATPAPAPVTGGRRPLETVATTTTEPMIREAPPAAALRVDPATYAAAPVAVAPRAVVPRSVATARVVAASPAPATPTFERVTAPAGAPTGKIGCYTSAPVAEVVRLTNGGTAVVCTRGDGTFNGARSPVYPAGSPVGAALSGPKHAPETYAATARAKPHVTASTQGSIPKGYKAAWEDDRLNPNRGKGTAQGWAEQDQVWTRKVPAGLVSEQPKKKVVYRERVVVSTKSAPAPAVTPKATGGRIFVQVGTFGVAANADGASSRLSAAGIPVARSRVNKGGKALQVVLAGPFGSTGEAQTALNTARRAGFSDAFIR